nr:DUF58 domain-containing protein [uncultured Neokomagataea sp.]
MTQQPPSRFSLSALRQQFSNMMRAPHVHTARTTPQTDQHAHANDSAQTALEALLLAALNLAQSLDAGQHGRRRSGTGDNFWQFRPYHQGEPASAIDWRQSARSTTDDTFWVREREQDTPHHLALWCDPSASMTWRSQPHLPTKTERAHLCGLALAGAALKGGERITPLTGNASGRSLSGHTALPQLAATLLNTPAHNALPDVTSAPPGAAVLVISDFLWDEVHLKQWCEEHSHYAGRLIFLCILDPAEQQPQEHGRIRFDGLEGGSITLPAFESLGPRYQHAMSAHLTTLQHHAAALRAPFILHRTDENPLPALLTLHSALEGAR